MDPGVIPRLGKHNIKTEGGECVIRTPEDEEAVSAVEQTINHIENSTEVVVGSVTHFNCPVTIIQSKERSSKRKFDSSEGTRNFKSLRNIPNLYLGIALTFVGVLVIAMILIFTMGKMTDDSSTVQLWNKTVMEDVEVIPREMWGAREPLAVRVLEHPTKFIIIAHTGCRTCMTFEACAGVLQTLQTMAVETGSPDIGYNFMVSGDGNVYIARGWDAINYLQSHSISVAFLGNYSYDKFTDKMQRALRNLIEVGLQMGKLDANYVLLSHNQTTATLSPGTRIYEVISKWPHFYRKTYIEIPD